MRSGHHRLLRSAGFSDSIELDITPAFRATAAAWLAESEALRGRTDTARPVQFSIPVSGSL